MHEVVDGTGRTIMKYDVELTELRQKCRDKFTEKLRDAFPNPADRVRQQVEPMFDRWWPGTVKTKEEAQ